MKAKTAREVKKLQDIPNIGPAIARELAVVGVTKPVDLKKVDAFSLYQELCRVTGKRYDPCVLDTFMAAVEFMNGSPSRPWWYYTKNRKREYPNI